MTYTIVGMFIYAAPALFLGAVITEFVASKCLFPSNK